MSITILEDYYDQNDNVNNSIRIKIESVKSDESANNFYIDTSFVNLLRRYIISNIETYTFLYINKENTNEKIKTIEIGKDNINNINNDMLKHRISLLTINIPTLEILVLFYYFKNNTQFTIENYPNFEIDQEILYKKEFEFKIYYPSDESDAIEDYIYVTDENIQNDLFNNLLEENEEFIDYFKTIYNLFKEKYYLDDSPDLQQYIENLTLFKPYYYNKKKYFNIITKIKKTQKIDITMYLKKNSVISDQDTEQNIKFSPVSACRSTFAIDYERVYNKFIEQEKTKNQDIINEIITQAIAKYNLYNNDDIQKFIEEIKTENVQLSKEITNYLNKFKFFCIEEAERYYFGQNNQIDRIHILEYESIDFYNNIKILELGIDSLINNKNINNINILGKIAEAVIQNQNLPLTNYTTNMEIEPQFKIFLSNKLDNSIDILIHNGDHGIGYLIQSYLQYIDKSILKTNFINYIGYKIIHPLSTELLLTIQFSTKIAEIDIIEILNKLFQATFRYLTSIVDTLKPNILN